MTQQEKLQSSGFNKTSITTCAALPLNAMGPQSPRVPSPSKPSFHQTSDQTLIPGHGDARVLSGFLSGREAVDANLNADLHMTTSATARSVVDSDRPQIRSFWPGG